MTPLQRIKVSDVDSTVASRRPNDQSRFWAIRGSRMYVPATSRRCRAARSSGWALVLMVLWPSHNGYMNHQKRSSKPSKMLLSISARNCTNTSYSPEVPVCILDFPVGLRKRWSSCISPVSLPEIPRGWMWAFIPTPNLSMLIHVQLLQKFKIKIEDPPRRKHMVFLGGAVLADIMKNREEFWISREEWFEQGIRSLDKLGRGENNWSADLECFVFRRSEAKCIMLLRTMNSSMDRWWILYSMGRIRSQRVEVCSYESVLIYNFIAACKRFANLPFSTISRSRQFSVVWLTQILHASQ